MIKQFLFGYIQDHDDEVQSMAWKQSGNLFASQSKDLQLRIFDARSGSKVNQCPSHEGMKDSKVVWVGNSDRVMTTGFSGVSNHGKLIDSILTFSCYCVHCWIDIPKTTLTPISGPFA